MASPMPTLIAIFSSVGTWCGFVRPNCFMRAGRTFDSYISFMRGAGTGRFAPACGPRAFASFCLPLARAASRFSFGAPAPTAGFSLVAIDQFSLAAARDRFARLHGETLLRAVFIDATTHARRVTRLGIEQHHVRGVDRGREIDDPALLLGATRLAMALHDVDALDRHATGLGVDADDLAFLALVVAAKDTNGVALGDVQLRALGVVRVALAIDHPRAVGLPVFVDTHIRSPQAPATRSSCSASHGARAPRDRR